MRNFYRGGCVSRKNESPDGRFAHIYYFDTGITWSLDRQRGEVSVSQTTDRGIVEHYRTPEPLEFNLRFAVVQPLNVPLTDEENRMVTAVRGVEKATRLRGLSMYGGILDDAAHFGKD